MLEPFNRTQPVRCLSLGLSKSLSYEIISLQLCFVVLSINNLKKLVTSLLYLHFLVTLFSLFLPLKCSTCVSLVSLSTIKVVQFYIFFIFFIFYTGKSKKIQENILENTGISCLNLDGHPVTPQQSLYYNRSFSRFGTHFTTGLKY